MTPLDCRRDEFSIPADVHYLNCAYMGPLPVAAQQAGIAGLRRKAVPTGIVAGDFFEDADRARRLFADLVNAPDPQRVAIVPAVSYGAAIVARNLRPRAGQRVVVLRDQFPSNVHAWRSLAARHGLELVTVEPPRPVPPRGEAWNRAVVEAIDERTTLVALPQVHWTDGTRFDLESIGRRARAFGATFVIDATQSIGAMPFDVQAIGPDAVFCAGYKWLLGPYGIGFAWLGDRFDDAEPIEETWIARAGSEDFRRLVDYRDEYQPGAVRFDVGERSNFILLPMLVAALERVIAWRPERVRDYCAGVMQRAIGEARALGFVIEPAAWRGAHLFGLHAPAGLDIGALQAALATRGVYVSLRGNAVRVSPNVYNDAGDADAFVQALRAATVPVSR